LKKLSKKLKTLIFSGAGLLLLAALTLVLVLTQNPPEITDSDTDILQTRVDFSSLEPEDIVSIRVINSSGEYTIEQPVEGFLIIPELRGAPLNQTALLHAARYIANFWARDTVEENAPDLEQYGLGDSAIRVSAVFENGETLELLIGDETPTAEDVTYVRRAGENTVYIAWSWLVDIYREDSLHFVSLAVSETYDEAGFPDIERLVIEQAGEERHVIELVPEGAEDEVIFNRYRFTEPVRVDVDHTRGNDLMLGMFGLTADRVANVGALPEELSHVLDEPAATVGITVGGRTSILIIGGRFFTEGEDEDNEAIFAGFYGVHSDYPDVLYVFAPEALSWLNYSIDNVMAAIFHRPMIYTVSDFVIETPLHHLAFRLTGDNRNNEEYFLDGEPINADNFKKLYEYCFSMRADTLFAGTMEDLGNMPFLARFSYVYKGSRPDDVIEFYDDGNLRVVIVLNGEPVFTTRQMYITRLMQNIEAYLSGAPVIMEY
jgi:hypothetical protein